MVNTQHNLIEYLHSASSEQSLRTAPAAVTAYIDKEMSPEMDNSEILLVLERQYQRTGF